ncbi:DinB family protein [Urechidicola sp. KH5]
MQDQFDILHKNRALITKIVSGLTLEQLNTIPQGFKNNIAWNLAHLVATQQLLCYFNSGNKMLVDDTFIETYKKGTAPIKLMSQEELDQVLQFFKSLPEQLEKDYSNGLLNNYNVYTTSVEVTLDSVEKAIGFNNFHEGIHLGCILALRKLV